jgi:hypothetical protein
MNADSNETELDPRALAISVWENEGGSQAPDTPDGQFGRRVEMDRSWTIYHVFTGVPARVDGSALTDLSRSAATDGMLSLNLEIRFFVEAGALAISGTALPTMPMSEARCLSVFDAVRTPILDVAREAYSHGRRNYYTLTAADFL